MQPETAAGPTDRMALGAADPICSEGERCPCSTPPLTPAQTTFPAVIASVQSSAARAASTMAAAMPHALLQPAEAESEALPIER